MKLLVFGATDGTGQQIVEQALAHSHEVTAVVRNPSAWFVQAPRLHVEKDSLCQAFLEQFGTREKTDESEGKSDACNTV